MFVNNNCKRIMLKKVRVLLAWLFWIGITLLFLDFTGALHGYLGWMAKLQFLPAVLALNVGVIVALVLLTLVGGRVYCSVICPLGVFQDGISWLGTRRSRTPYKFTKELKWLRYGVWVLFVVLLILGVQAAVALLAPYSAYGRMVQSLLQPVWLWGNNLLAGLSERWGSYAFYQKEVWLRSVPTLVVTVVTLVVVVALSFKGGRTWCNTICPVGTTLGFLSRFAMFRPLIDHDKCKHCKACEQHCKAQCISIGKDTEFIDHSRCVDCFNCIDKCKFGALQYRFAWGKGHSEQSEGAPLSDSSPSAQNDKSTVLNDGGRRAMMAGTVAVVGAAVLKGVEARAQEAAKKVDGGFAEVLPKQAPEREVPLTPPGSRSVKDFYRRCTACQLCVAECPNNVLRPSGSLEHLMQPEMSFEKGWCRPECTRCSELCPAGAIGKVTREEKTQYRMGTSRVNLELCVSAIGKAQCGKCAQACPSGAIRMVEKDGMQILTVAEEVCTGCGACEFLCPSRPISAITVNGRIQHI